MPRRIPYRGLITDEGAAVIPLDLRGTGFWLTGCSAIRDDGRIETADPTSTTCTGVMCCGYTAPLSLAEAANGDAVTLDTASRWPKAAAPTFELFRVFLPNPKYALSGAGGVEASFDLAAASVIANRAAKPGWWGRDIRSVCLAPAEPTTVTDREKPEPCPPVACGQHVIDGATSHMGGAPSYAFIIQGIPIMELSILA